jgi:ribonuclease HI
MELAAVLEAIRRAPKGSHLEILTDSNLVIGWLSKGWKRNDPTIRTLCAEIDLLMAQRGPEGAVSFRYVRGHRGDARNERADRLATEAIEKVRRKAA